MKSNISIKPLNLNIIFSRFSAFDGNIIFSIIPNIFRKKSKKQDNDKKEKKYIIGVNTLLRR